jgi:hypothetical protein
MMCVTVSKSIMGKKLEASKNCLNNGLKLKKAETNRTQATMRYEQVIMLAIMISLQKS